MELVPYSKLKLQPVITTTENNIKKLKAITPILLSFMRSKNGVGLAANQVGLKGSFFVADLISTKDKLFINPLIIKKKKPIINFEGCLTFNKEVVEPINRYESIVVQYINEEGKRKQGVPLKGTDSFIFQHEVDHLKGLTIVDKTLQKAHL